MTRMVNEPYVPTREELEERLDELNFVRSKHDPDLWIFADGTKSVLFTKERDGDGLALYSDSDQHEPGRPLNYRQICAAASGRIALAAPELERVLLLGPPLDQQFAPDAPKLLGEGVVEARFESEPDTADRPPMDVEGELVVPQAVRIIEPEERPSHGPGIRLAILVVAAVIAVGTIVVVATLALHG